MILAYELDLRTDAGVYERIFLRTLKQNGLDGKIVREHFALKMYVEAEDAQTLERFADTLTANLPHSIYLHATDVSVIETMPETEGYIPPSPSTQRMIPFCPQCAGRVLDPNDPHWYDAHMQCEACGYGVYTGTPHNDRDAIMEAVMTIHGGGIVELNTHYGTLYLGQLSSARQDTSYDILVHDLAVLAECAYIQEHDVMALGAIEKPMVRLRTLPDFGATLPWDERRLVRFRLPDDMVLYLLMEELHHLGIDRVFVTATVQSDAVPCRIVDPIRQAEPIEAVVSAHHVAIVQGDKGLYPPEPLREPMPIIGAFQSVIREHRLRGDNIAGIHIDRREGAHILVYGRRYGTVKYLAFEDEAAGMASLFRRIVESDESGKRLMENFRRTHPERFNQLLGIAFDHPRLDLYRLWGVLALVVGLSDDPDLERSAQIFEEHAQLFDGIRGPRIDYRIDNTAGEAHFDPLMTIRTAISFILAGVEADEIAYGAMESFCEFVANEMDQVAQSMGTEGIALSGSLLTNGRLFAKITEDLSLNHTVYLNNQLPVHGRNVLYGGTDLLTDTGFA